MIDGQVRFEPVLTGSNKLSCCLNLRLDRRSGSALPLNLGPDLGPVLQSSGSNFGSGPNRGITNADEKIQEQAFWIVRNLAENESGIDLVFRELGADVLLSSLTTGLESPHEEVVLQVCYKY